MKKKNIIILIGINILLILLMVFINPIKELVKEKSVYQEEYITVYLEGEAKLTGDFSVPKSWTLGNLIDLIGVTDYADLTSINKKEKLVESKHYVIEQNKGLVSNKVNINTASLEDLKTLSGVGEAIAIRIIEYRKSCPFTSIEDIKKVSGIGDRMYEKIKNSITI